MDRGQIAARPPAGDTGDRIGWAEVFTERSLEIRGDLEDHEIRLMVRTASGIAVRGSIPGADHFAAATVPPDESARPVARRLLGQARLGDAGTDLADLARFPAGQALDPHDAVVAVHEALRGIDEGVRDAGADASRAVVRLRLRHYRVACTDGVDVTESGLHIHLVTEAFDGASAGGAGAALTDLADLERAGHGLGCRAGYQARRLARAVRPESRRCAVVFAPVAAGVLVHEVVGHSLEADAVAAGSALWRTRDTAFGPPELSIWDDGRSAGAWEAVAADEEGTPLEQTKLVVGGVVSGLATDRTAAVRLGLPRSSGHARRGGFAHRPAARVRHTIVGNGTDSVASLIAGTGDGVWIEAVESGEANVRDGRFTIRVTEGRRIRNGRLGETLAAFTVTGTLADFGRLDGLGDDGTSHHALCGRGTHWLPVSGVTPTIRLPLADVHGGA